MCVPINSVNEVCGITCQVDIVLGDGVGEVQRRSWRRVEGKESQGVGWGEGRAAELVSGALGIGGGARARARCTAPARRRSQNAAMTRL